VLESEGERMRECWKDTLSKMMGWVGELTSPVEEPGVAQESCACKP
jgi:hypothetical protein